MLGFPEDSPHTLIVDQVRLDLSFRWVLLHELFVDRHRPQHTDDFLVLQLGVG